MPVDILILLYFLTTFVVGAIAIYSYIKAIKAVFGSIFIGVDLSEFIGVFVLNSRGSLNKKQLQKRNHAGIWILLLFILVMSSQIIV